jgi:hypothetical protein
MARAAATGLRRAPSRRLGQRSSSGAASTLRLRVYLTRGRLDRQLATGTVVGWSEALALRARQLTTIRARRRTADNLRGTVRYVDRTRSQPIISAVVIDRTAVSAGREAILGLAERLEGTAPVTARGMALVQALLTDSQSPLFNPHSDLTVTAAVWEVNDALHAAGELDPVDS